MYWSARLRTKLIDTIQLAPMHIISRVHVHQRGASLMAKRYEVAGESWVLIEDLFSTPHYSRRPRADDRVMLNGIFWVLCSGVAWRDVPERFGP